MKTDTTEVNIDLSNIPEDVGKVYEGPFGPRLHISSMNQLHKWVNRKLPAVDNMTINVIGTMPNCVALQLGLWLAGKGTVVYRSHTGFRRELV